MRLVIQRVRDAAVETAGREVARIGPGLLVLVGFAAADRAEDLARAADTLLRLRIFDDGAGRLNRCLTDIGGEVLVVPEITLVASLTKGLRPSFDPVAPPEQARRLFEGLVQALRASHPKVSAGIFQADMVVRLANDGPVTLVLDGPVSSFHQGIAEQR